MKVYVLFIYCSVSCSQSIYTELSFGRKTAACSRSSANRIAHYKACLKMCIYFYAFIIHKKKDNNKKNKNLLRCFCCRFLFSMLKCRVCIQLVCVCVCVSIFVWLCLCLFSLNVLSKTCLYVCMCVWVSCCHVHVCIASVCFSLFSRLCGLSNIYTTLFIPYSVYRKCN